MLFIDDERIPATIGSSNNRLSSQKTDKSSKIPQNLMWVPCLPETTQMSLADTAKDSVAKPEGQDKPDVIGKTLQLKFILSF